MDDDDGSKHGGGRRIRKMTRLGEVAERVLRRVKGKERPEGRAEEARREERTGRGTTAIEPRDGVVK